MAQIQEADEIARQMKAFETNTPNVVPSEMLLVVRADGHRFSRYTKGFKKPFDDRIMRSMKQTTADAVAEFTAATGYNFSDEITLIFPQIVTDVQGHPFGGRSQKIASLVASFCSIRFNFYMQKEVFSPDEKVLAAKVAGCSAYFDGRAIGFKTKEGVLKCVFWRSRMDCARNTVFALAQKAFGHSAVNNKSVVEMKEMLEKAKEAQGGSFTAWSNLAPEYKYGVFIKREEYKKTALDQQTQQQVEVVRHRITSKSFKLEMSVQHTDLLLAKIWPCNIDLLPS